MEEHLSTMSNDTFMIRVYPGPLAYDCDFTAVSAQKATTAYEIVKDAVRKLHLGQADNYELAEVLSSGGLLCKERCLEPMEKPVCIMLLWPKNSFDNSGMAVTNYKFFLRKKDLECLHRTSSWRECTDDSNPVSDFLMKFLQQPKSNKEYPDLCNLPDLNELTLLENLRTRFEGSNIYTYVGSILIAVNPFKFFPIYNPRYVKMYQNKRLGELPPHIFAIADAAFYTMLRRKKNQCIVISGESGSGKTESTNLLLHHLTALSRKGTHGSGVEQTILGAGPVLEAFGNAKTIHNNNSSRFGKFIQVNYKENGMVHGAIVEKYLLEKSRIVSQAKNERNYHVFYYLLAGAEEEEREMLHLSIPEDFQYLSKSGCYTLEGEDEIHEFARLKQSMEMVGFSSVTQKRIFSVMSAVLHLGNVEFKKKGDQHHDESVTIKSNGAIEIISDILQVKEKTLNEALTQKRATAGGETVVMNYRMHDAIATRDAMAKCLYGALFDWIVLKVNQALLAKRHNSVHQGNSIGVLDIFGFEDFNNKNSFEQFCINYANEHLQYYFNQHIFKFEQEEYKKEGIQWKNIEFIDNTECLELFSRRPHGLFSLLDEECSFPGATNETLLSKFHHHNRSQKYYMAPQLKEPVFIIMHYAGKVKYNIKDFREKNSDLIRPDIVSVLKSSNLSFVRELMGLDPVAVLRWSIVKAVIKSIFAFIKAGRRFRSHTSLKPDIASKKRKKSDQPLIESYSPHGSLTRKNKPTRQKSVQPTMLKDIKTLKDIASRTMYGGSKVSSKKHPASVGAQFQWSLTRLMSTLQQANPFFIRCIKSNADKAPCHFDDVLVLRQLRYTGMLATVKIRQSGYNYRFLFEEFIQLYNILLPKKRNSTAEDVVLFLKSMNLNENNYQIGSSKVFLRESEKIRLDEALHTAIMQRVVRVQRWLKTKLERRHFLQVRKSALTLQVCIRVFLAKRRLKRIVQEKRSSVIIQKWVRGYVQRCKYYRLINAVILIQSWYRGTTQRRTYKKLLQIKREREYEEEVKRKQQELEELRSVSDDSAAEFSLDKPYKNVDETTADSGLSDVAAAFPDKPSPQKLSPDRLKVIEDVLEKGKDQLDEPPSPSGDFSQAHKSPFRRARRHFKQIIDVRQHASPRTPDGPLSPGSPSEKHIGIPTESGARDEDIKALHQKRRKKDDIKQPVPEIKSVSPTRGNWSLAKTTLWEYPADLIITDFQELVNLDVFLNKKSHEYQKNSNKDSIFDQVFIKSLSEFHKEMQATIGTEVQKKEVSVPYKNLLAKFVCTLEAEVSQENADESFPVTLGVNAFRGYMDEFIKHHKKKDKKRSDSRPRRERRQKKEKEIFEYLNHKFTLVQFGIPTFCEYCSNFIWLLERASVCQVCKYTCHKKCVTKSTVTCKGAQRNQDPNTRIFGVPILSLVTEDVKIPVIVDRLIEMIELHGLYTEGIYRKPGNATRVKQMKANIDSGAEDLMNEDPDAYNIHLLTALHKTFYRELPEPLLTFECYDDFIRTTEIHDEKERLQALFAVIEKLPRCNHDLLERLVFHLARVASHESANKMSANGLAIIFAPVLLRTNKKLQAQDSLNQIPKQTMVVHQIISEQLNKLRDFFHNISVLETAEASASEKLDVVRRSIHSRSPVRTSPVSSISESLTGDMDNVEDEERALNSQLQSIRKERENLASSLVALECRHHSSDDDGIDSVYDTAEEDVDEQSLNDEQVISAIEIKVPSIKRRGQQYNGKETSKETYSSEEDLSSSIHHERERSYEDSEYIVPKTSNMCDDDDDEIMV